MSRKWLALFLNDAALPTLYLSSRILEFPLGVFTLAIATVYFPKLSKLGDSGAEFRREYSNGLVVTMGIAIPAMFGIIATSRDILALLFEWGLFGTKDVDVCLPVLIVSVIGLPFFALSTFATRGFHSTKDTRTPVKVSYWAFAANVALSLALMFPFGAAGLAGANVGAAALQALMLDAKLKRQARNFGRMPRDFENRGGVGGDGVRGGRGAERACRNAFGQDARVRSVRGRDTRGVRFLLRNA